MNNHNINEDKNKIYNEAGKIIGWIEGEAICKNAIASKHMLRKPRGWAWDKSVLERAETEGKKKTVIHEKEGNLEFWANLQDFWQHGVKISRGYGEQVCLPLKYWNVMEPGQPKQLDFKLLF